MHSLHSLGARTTIYGDRHDRPLLYAETLMRVLTPSAWRSLGRLHGAPWARELATSTARGPASPGHAGSHAYASPSGRASEMAISISGLAEMIDVIDTTWMHAGMPAGDPDLAVNTAMRHTQFVINQLLVDDLAELLTTGRRAAQRHGRLRQRAGTGVFHFFESDEGDARDAADG